MVEEYYLTGNGNNGGDGTIASRVPLASWTPHLTQFICSAATGRSWENPNWIPPHVLLPRHPTVELIGVRDMDERFLDDTATQGHAGRYVPYSSLLELFGSFLRDAMFPNLRYIRDLSSSSDGMRRGLNAVNAPLLLFWSRVLENCGKRRVRLEDCDGVNITNQDLMNFAHQSAVV